MIVHFMKQDALIQLKTNVEENATYYSKPTNEWISSVVDIDNPFAEYKLQFDDFQLNYDINMQNSSKIDVENAIILYSAMKNISDTQATDERLWAGLCHCDFWEYLHYRWYEGNNRRSKSSNIASRYFLSSSSGLRRSLFLNSLSKLWWLSRLTYDKNRKDPYELTRYFENDFSTKSLILFSSNYMSNMEISKGLISALIQLENDGYTLPGQKRNVYYRASQYLNVLGGTHILDYFCEEEIKERVLKYMWGLKGLAPPNSSNYSKISSNKELLLPAF